MITDQSSHGDFCAWCDTREAFEVWERKVLQRIEDRHGVRPSDTGIRLVDLFREIDLHPRASTPQ